VVVEEVWMRMYDYEKGQENPKVVEMSWLDKGRLFLQTQHFGRQ
jgi:hypothetical protein